jgi:hypothetical protein
VPHASNLDIFLPRQAAGLIAHRTFSLGKS